MELNLLNTILNNGRYEENKPRLREDIFSNNSTQRIYNLIVDAQNKYQIDLAAPDLLAIWASQNPTATEASLAEISSEVDAVAGAVPITDEVAQDVIHKLWQQQVGREVADIGIAIAEGKDDAMRGLKDLIEKTNEDFVIDDFGPPTTSNIYEIIAEVSDDNRWPFNLSTLNRQLYGIGPTDFYIVAARPETGKTAFLASLVAAPDGWAHQGAKVLWIGNEESTKKVKLRTFQACSGMTKDEIIAHPEVAWNSFKSIDDNIVMKDTQEWDLDKLESYIRKINPAILLLDQADKINLRGSFPSTHEKIRELYRQLRELAKRHHCGVIAVSQAGLTAEGRTRVDFSDLENSRTGKAAECDVCLGIGRRETGEGEDPDYTRYLTLSKNKISGVHTMITCELQHEISRYVE